MTKLSLRRLLSRLAAIALAATPAAASPSVAKPRCEEVTAIVEDDREIDREQLDAEQAAAALGRGLALAMTELRPITATQLAATWSTSPDALRRKALAIALEWSFPLVGDSLVIDHLARDPDPAIRGAAARAAWVRRPTGGDPGVLARLSDDPDPMVRSIAHAARV
ncbi:MAG: hypothetical protein ABI867_44645 [Kofleriaceae bacterium]